jgi:phage/plasmid primase-like uncharacterized protein
MSYMTFEEQIASHNAFLKEQNLEIDTLQIDGGFVRCIARDQTDEKRGELCYKTQKNQLRNGMVGLATWCRGMGGQIITHKTYGLSPQNSNVTEVKSTLKDTQEEIVKAEMFWKMSDETGEAEYLLKKGVGYYGIRFRCTEYGKVAILPLRDINGRFSSYQLINPDGSKRFARNIGIVGLLHMLQQPINGFPIGLAESYVTAASCFEATGMAMVTAYSSANLKPVALELKRRFPQSLLIVFGDDDRHLSDNKGRCSAFGTKEALGVECKIVLPDFKGYPVSREFSDWNDYIRENGVRAAREAIQNALNET